MCVCVCVYIHINIMMDRYNNGNPILFSLAERKIASALFEHPLLYLLAEKTEADKFVMLPVPRASNPCFIVR